MLMYLRETKVKLFLLLIEKHGENMEMLPSDYLWIEQVSHLLENL